MSADRLAYSFFGPNTAFSARPGDIGGGYFIVDPSKTARDAGIQFQLRTYDWGLDSLNGAAIDNSLADGTARDRQIPIYLGGSYAKASNRPANEPPPPTSNGFLRYDGGVDFLNVYTDTGPPVAAGQMLGDFLSSHGFVSESAGPIVGINDTRSQPDGRYTYIDAPSISQFTAEDVFKNPRSFGFGADKREPLVSGAAIYAEFTPHVHVGSPAPQGYEIPMKLDDVAALFGVDHFNWKQSVTVPANWTVLYSNGISSNPVLRPAPDPIIEPIPNPDPPVFYTLVNEFGVHGAVSPYMSDVNPEYLDDTNLVALTKPFAIEFFDAPRTDKKFNKNRLFQEFRTELVGVIPNASPTERL